jgi:hypothetical protein
MHLVNLAWSTLAKPISLSSPQSFLNMTLQTQAQKSTVFHKGRQFLFKTALLAAPVAAFAGFSPAQAASLTFTGFTGAFAESNWTYSGNGTGTIIPTRLTIKSPAGPTNILSSGKYTYNLSTLNNYAPVPNPGKKYLFQSGVIDKVKIQASGFDFILAQDANNNTLSFELLNDLTESSAPFPSGEGRASSFQYTATYKEVPGPLPVAAAVGAFAWSRTIRRRLSSASQA